MAKSAPPGDKLVVGNITISQPAAEMMTFHPRHDDPASQIAGAARLLAERIAAARAAGYAVQMAFPVEALAAISVSATAKVADQG